MSRLVSAAEAEREFGVEGLATRVRVWKCRRKLLASGIDASGRPLYRVERIAELLDRDTPPVPARRLAGV